MIRLFKWHQLFCFLQPDCVHGVVLIYLFGFYCPCRLRRGNFLESYRSWTVHDGRTILNEYHIILIHYMKISPVKYCAMRVHAEGGNGLHSGGRVQIKWTNQATIRQHWKSGFKPKEMSVGILSASWFIGWRLTKTTEYYGVNHNTNQWDWVHFCGALFRWLFRLLPPTNYWLHYYIYI